MARLPLPRARWLWLLVPLLLADAYAAEPVLPGTRALDPHPDRSAEMVSAIDRYLLGALERSIAERAALWQRDYTSADAYSRSVDAKRAGLRRIIGAVDERVPMTGFELVATLDVPAQIAAAERYTVTRVRWPVFENVHGEGLLVQPRGPVRLRAVVIPDADQTPEMIVGLLRGQSPAAGFARRLAENGCQLVIPVLISRDDEFSGSSRVNRFTNLPHREWIYRQAYEMGRHIIGYEVQKVLAVVDGFARENSRGDTLPIGVAGYGEGGLLAFYASAIDPRIDAALVSGYFDSRQKVWREPIYRNVFGLLHEFGDAEIASLIAPRALIVDPSPAPTTDGPPPARRGRSASAAPGIIATPDSVAVRVEFARAQKLAGAHGRALTLAGSSDEALHAFWRALRPEAGALAAVATPPVSDRKDFDVAARQHRQLRELEEHTQKLVRDSEAVRRAFFWDTLKATTPAEWSTTVSAFRTQFWTENIGRMPAPNVPMNPRVAKFGERRNWVGYDVVLDVWPDVFAWGYLLLPKNLRPGERRPVVVCQHGLEGLPIDTVNDDTSTRAFGYYKGFAAQLADRGFVVFSPHNPYRGRDHFRGLQRKLNPLGHTLYSVIAAQHGRILDWLSAQPFVDSSRIGFYGLSYGGKTAMRMPPLFDRYAVTICSGDFNEWIRKNTATDLRYSYMFAPEYEMFEFNLGNTFNYAEMAAMIAPRPFMVERGHYDGVGTDEWVSYEYAKVRRLYVQLGIPERTAIEYFDGPHTINGQGTFEFLHKHLDWPRPK